MGEVPIALAKIAIVPLATSGPQWTQCSLRLPVGTVPTLIADGRGASPADKCVTVTQSSLQPTGVSA